MLSSSDSGPVLFGLLELLATLLELGAMLLELAIELLLGAMLLELIIDDDEMATELELACCGALELLDGVGLPVQAASAAMEVASNTLFEKRFAKKFGLIIVFPCWFIVIWVFSQTSTRPLRYHQAPAHLLVYVAKLRITP